MYGKKMQSWIPPLFPTPACTLNITSLHSSGTDLSLTVIYIVRIELLI